MHHFSERGEGSFGVRPLAKIGNRALIHRGGHIAKTRLNCYQSFTVIMHEVHRRHVDTWDLGEFPQKPLP